MLLHRTRKAAPEPFLRASAPSREGLVVAVACLFAWYGRAAGCAAQGIPWVLGPARSRTASQGGKANTAPSDAQTIAALLRGGRLPHAYGYPAERRATRAWLRRRTPLLRTRAELLTPVPTTHAPYPRPELGQTVASRAQREGVADRCPPLAGQKNLAVALALSTYDAQLLGALALYRLTPAKHPAAPPLSLVPPVPGMGKLLSLVLLYARHARDRCPRGQAFASSWRLGKGAQESAGPRVGPSGQQSGTAQRTGAFSEAAARCWRHNEAGQTSLARLEQKPAQGQARPLRAHTLARAVYDMRQRTTALEMALVLRP
jgi:hypothetical protein